MLAHVSRILVVLAALLAALAAAGPAAPLTPEQLFRAPVVFTVPGMESVRVASDRVYREAAREGEESLRADVYTPASGGPFPVVVFVHGGFPDGLDISPKSAGQYTSWGRLVAASGMAAVTFNHRLRMSPQGIVRLGEAASDLTSLIGWIRRHGAELSLDSRRLAVFAVSAGGPLLNVALGEPGLRCLVDYYGFLDVHDLDWFARARAATPGSSWSLIDALDREGLPPILIARAGRDTVPRMKETIDRFVAKALSVDAPLTLLNHATGEHAFDLQNDDPRSREIIAATLRFLQVHLQ
jgi:acetyl esterase/lipase